MDWLTNLVNGVVNGPNALFALGFILLIIIIGIIAIKKGYISFNGKMLRIGEDEKTRNLIQNQFEYAQSVMEGCISDLPPGLDVYRSKYIISKALDVIQKAIVFNNMSKEPYYVKAKQALVYQAVRKRADNVFFRSPEFKKYCDDIVERLIYDLVDMKLQMK